MKKQIRTLLAIAAVTASAYSMAAGSQGPQFQPIGAESTAPAASNTGFVPPAYRAPTLACVAGYVCGTIQSVAEKDKLAKSSGLGTAGGAVLGGILGRQMGDNNLGMIVGAVGGAVAGNYAERRMRADTVDVVTVRLDDGSTHAFDLDHPSRYAAGQRVKFFGAVEASRMSHF